MFTFKTCIILRHTISYSRTAHSHLHILIYMPPFKTCLYKFQNESFNIMSIFCCNISISFNWCHSSRSLEHWDRVKLFSYVALVFNFFLKSHDNEMISNGKCLGLFDIFLVTVTLTLYHFIVLSHCEETKGIWGNLF